MTDASHFFAIEKRQRRRWELVFYLRVYNQSDGSVLGHVIDISEEGLMLLSEAPIELDKDFDLTLELPASDSNDREKISLKAHSIWKSSDTNPDLFDTGFSLVEPDKDSIDVIKTLIDELQF